jgi:hypothetical protein
MTHTTLDGRTFAPVGDAEGSGEVGIDTRFRFREAEDGTVWARYGGGRVRLGFLVGVREGTDLTFRYVQVHEDGETASGHSTDRIETLSDGRLRLHEAWAWDLRTGSGESVLEEVRDRDRSQGRGHGR